ELYARPEAIARYWQAVDLLDRLPRTQERSPLHIDGVRGLVATPGWMLDEARRREGLRQIEAAMRPATEIDDVGLLVRLEAREGNISSDESVLRRMLARAEASGDR